MRRHLLILLALGAAAFFVVWQSQEVILVYYLLSVIWILPLYYFLCLCVVLFVAWRDPAAWRSPAQFARDVFSLLVPGLNFQGPIAATERRIRDARPVLEADHAEFGGQPESAKHDGDHQWSAGGRNCHSRGLCHRCHIRRLPERLHFLHA